MTRAELDAVADWFVSHLKAAERGAAEAADRWAQHAQDDPIAADGAASQFAVADALSEAAASVRSELFLAVQLGQIPVHLQ